MTLVLNGTTGVSAVDGSASTPAIQGNDTNTGMFFPAADTIAFAEGGVESARFDSSGNLLFATRSGAGNTGQLVMGTTQTPGVNAYLIVTASSAEPYPMGVKATSSSQGMLGFFDSSNNVIGSISKSGSNTAYNTSSDYRLKEDIQPMMGALAKVVALKPCTYKWKMDGSNGEGFIAHELAEVVPGCVTGAKDAVDADGNIKPQGIDTSFLVATLTAAIQEQQALITSLTARIAALEGAAS
jgi:hypothetical protein